ncbi:MAG: DUF4897 domain-containing protein [Halodesulfurarchaeum sp.]
MPIALVLVVTLSTLGIGVGPARAQAAPTEPTIDVAIHETGTVDLSVVMTYNLSEAAEREAFEGLQTDETLLAEMESRFAARMKRVANASADATGRSIEVNSVDVSMQKTDSTGIVELGVTFTDLAAIEEGTITLTEPFASGFETDRTLRITVPDGYEVVSVTPQPDERSDDTLIFAPDRSLAGFELVASESGGPITGTTATSTPGMGLVVGGCGLLGAWIFARRR